jgi:hypothetical protein
MSEDIFDRICTGSDGVPRSCAPTGFPAAPDVIWLGNGDGTFRRLGNDAGFDVPEGDGLGIIAADFDHSGKLSLFVGNDGRANFLFVPEPSDGPTTQWRETGVLSGLAYDDAGMAQACMGIGAADANNDRLIDLFVTNFYLESNAYYENLGSLGFQERARTVGLREPSMEMLGFGAQFLDADRDGWEDIVLVNGHVDDFSYKQLPYKMRPQFFVNQQGRFAERPPEALGQVFQQTRLGRGLATLDWNRDGLVDAAVSNIGDPAALLTNETTGFGRGLSVRLVGKSGSRDAIGTRVQVTANGQTRERQLTGGDGYQASNERAVRFGLGHLPEDAVVEMTVFWPGGREQKVGNIPIDRRIMIIEDQPVIWLP